jgi:hypothetical protein
VTTPSGAGGRRSPKSPPAPGTITNITRRSRTQTTARAAGKEAERLVVAFLRGHGARHAERRLAGNAVDRGDVAGIPGVVVEVKSPGPDAPIALGPWLKETLAERDNDGARLGLLVIKRRQYGAPGDWYWVTDGHTMAQLLQEAGWL